MEAEKTKVQLEEVTAALATLEAEVAKLSEEHQILVANCDAIQAELTVVETKVRRSNGLLQNLSKERERWYSSSFILPVSSTQLFPSRNEVSESFSVAMSNVVGNAILCAAFIAYSGFYDQTVRSQLLNSWKGTPLP